MCFYTKDQNGYVACSKIYWSHLILIRTAHFGRTQRIEVMLHNVVGYDQSPANSHSLKDGYSQAHLFLELASSVGIAPHSYSG